MATEHERIEAALAEVEKQLAVLENTSYVVDVRTKYNRYYPVWATVVDANTAMHMLLFVRRALQEGYDHAAISTS